jgi:hypothetical protein
MVVSPVVALKRTPVGSWDGWKLVSQIGNREAGGAEAIARPPSSRMIRNATASFGNRPAESVGGYTRIPAFSASALRWLQLRTPRSAIKLAIVSSETDTKPRTLELSRCIDLG